MLPNLKTILYATDLGGNTRPALRMAASIANKYDSHVVLLHVIEPLSANAQAMLDDLLPSGTAAEIHEQAIEKLKQKIANRVEKFCEDELPEGAQFPHGKTRATHCRRNDCAGDFSDGGRDRRRLDRYGYAHPQRLGRIVVGIGRQ